MLIAPYEPQREVHGDGPESAPILLLIDCPASSDAKTGRPLSGGTGYDYFRQITAAGLRRDQIRIECVAERTLPKSIFYTQSKADQDYWVADCRRRLADLEPRVIIPAGDKALEIVTGKRSLAKWNLSPLRQDNGTWVIPFPNPHNVIRNYAERVYVQLGAERVKDALSGNLILTKRDFSLRPSIEEITSYVEQAKNADWLTYDIETGSGQIICAGFATSPHHAICIPTLPTDWQTPEQFYLVWRLIAELLESDVRKNGQNIIYDVTYTAAYGIRVRNVAHDTMIAMRFLHAELPKGLDNVARVYLREPYWKDDGKDWGEKQDITQLYTYNCMDVCGTHEAMLAQRNDLAARKQQELFDSHVMRLWPVFAEMSLNGLPVRQSELIRLRAEAEKEIETHRARIEELSTKALGSPINPKSEKQIKNLLRFLGFRLPQKDGRDTSDIKALMKLRLKAPDSELLDALIGFSKANKQLSSYLNYRFNPKTSRMPFTQYAFSTETWRNASGTDPWDRGLNVQTIPRELKSQFGYDEEKEHQG